uniref:Uncharacterized protein n=1 Tax=Rhipicephalus zambeziensis TaxID=60191 RepID=A0A224Y843_9ACAR
MMRQKFPLIHSKTFHRFSANVFSVFLVFFSTLGFEKLKSCCHLPDSLFRQSSTHGERKTVVLTTVFNGRVMISMLGICGICLDHDEAEHVRCGNINLQLRIEGSHHIAKPSFSLRAVRFSPHKLALRSMK